MTAAVVAAAALLGAGPAPGLFAEASSLVLGAVVFEFAMLPLLLFADGALRLRARGARAAVLLTGALATLALGSGHALTLGEAALIPFGLWRVAMRLRVPRGAIAFGPVHVATVGGEAGTALTAVVVALLGLFAIGSLLRAPGSDEAPGWVYALAWGGFYVALAFIMPRARRQAWREHGRAEAALRAATDATQPPSTAPDTHASGAPSSRTP